MALLDWVKVGTIAILRCGPICHVVDVPGIWILHSYAVADCDANDTTLSPPRMITPVWWVECHLQSEFILFPMCIYRQSSHCGLCTTRSILVRVSQSYQSFKLVLDVINMSGEVS